MPSSMYVPKFSHQKIELTNWRWTPAVYVYADAAAAAKTPQELSAWLSVNMGSGEDWNEISPLHASLIGSMSNPMVIDGSYKLSENLHPISLRVFVLTHLQYPKSVLYDFTEDESFLVRANVASTVNLPADLQHKLAADPHVMVREALKTNPTVSLENKIVASLY